ncbi:MAG: glycosyltransferase family 2 protein [Nitrososphaerota archaeon]|nr:glycosyltransferase family 2 protein [Candidatus Bathyarchaeota archaeon]MDW8062258.1 glycosyltransferase family 2 protein [Nitrososphaerota archaeon]
MDVSVIMAVHNEERYLPRSLSALAKSEFKEFIVILDRCTDNSENIVKKFFPKAKIVRKYSQKWKNSYAENLHIGFNNAESDLICIHDADIESPYNFLYKLTKYIKGSVVSVSPLIQTDKKASFLNLLYYYWEKTYNFAPLGREPRGGVRLVKYSCLEEIGGFKDVEAPDTQLDLDLRRKGYQTRIVDEVICLHLRKFSFSKAIHSQILSGRMRRKIKMPLWRVLGHSIIRLRPFVLYGYLRKD